MTVASFARVLAGMLLVAGLALVAEGGVRLWQARGQNARIVALEAGREVAVGNDAPPRVLAARAGWLVAHGKGEAAQAIADHLTTNAPAPVRAWLLYRLGNAEFRHALDIFTQVPFRIVSPLIAQARAKYRQAIVLDPDNWDARYNFSIASALVRDTEAAQPTAGDEMSHERAAWPDIPGAPNGLP